MDATPSALFKFLVPKTPFILKTALWHSLSLSETSSKWDLRTELTVRILRQMLGPDSPTSAISKLQHLTTKDPGVKGPIWVSKVKFDVPEDEVRQAVFQAVDELSTSPTGDKEQWRKPDSVPLEVEWVGHRSGPGITKDTPEPTNLSESEKYANVVKDSTSDITVLYFHGGAMYLLDPATYRPTTGRIAKMSGGRVFSVRYRLAPQNPFPAALLDAFTSYLTLLYPPPGALHEAVKPERIVFAGDSAGGMLATSLQQLLLQIRRSAAARGEAAKVKWHGVEVEIPLPAGLALVSPWLDVTRGLPSIEDLAKFDYLPPPSHTRGMQFPKCDAWPSDPPRADLYCEGSAMLHPLVSPLAAMHWEVSPPFFFSMGQEMLRDEGAVLARRLHGQGVKVVWREFETMPHVFAYMLEGLKASDLHFEEFIDFCKKVTGTAGGSSDVQSSAQLILAKSLKREEVEIGKLTDLSDEVVAESMKKGRAALEQKFQGSGSVEARPML